MSTLWNVIYAWLAGSVRCRNSHRPSCTYSHLLISDTFSSPNNMSLSPSYACLPICKSAHNPDHSCYYCYTLLNLSVSPCPQESCYNPQQFLSLVSYPCTFTSKDDTGFVISYIAHLAYCLGFSLSSLSLIQIQCGGDHNCPRVLSCRVS